MKQLNVAIIGQGRSGRDIHGQFFLSNANEKFKVVAVVDALEKRRERAQAEYGEGVSVYADHRALYGRKDIDLVVNSSFSHMHFPVTMDLLTHGFNVVVEKPFSAHVNECQGMINAARENHVMLCVFQQSHFAPYYRRIREIMQSGILGRPVQIRIKFSGFGRRWDWQTSQRYYGGSLRNTGPHPLEQALDILDCEELPPMISRLDSVNSFGDAEDYVKILLMPKGKPVIDIEISSCDPFSDHTYELQCSNGGLKATTRQIHYKYYKQEECPEQHFTFDPIENAEGFPAYCSEKLKWYEADEDMDGDAFNSAVKLYYDNIYAHLTQGAELVIKPEKILQEIELIEKVHAQNPMPIRL